MDKTESKIGVICQVTGVFVAFLCALIGVVAMFKIGFLSGIAIWGSGFIGFLILYALGDLLCLAHENSAAMATALPLLRELVEWEKAGIIQPLPTAQPTVQGTDPLEQNEPDYELEAEAGDSVVAGNIVYGQQEEKEAHFKRSRVGEQIMCPFCGRIQRSNREHCFGCNAKFVMDN